MTRSEKRSVLSRTVLFRDLPDGALDAVLDAATPLTPSAKTVLFHQGDPPEQLMLVGTGFLKMGQVGGTGDASIIRVMGPGDVIGCVAVIRRNPLSRDGHDADRQHPSVLAGRMDAGAAEAASALRANALDVVGQRTEELLRGLHAMATERVDRRIARALLRLAAQTGHEVEGGTKIGFPLSRQDIAEMVGTDIYVVSRVLRRWAEQRMVIADRLRVVLLDQARLAQIADGAVDPF